MMLRWREILLALRGTDSASRRKLVIAMRGSHLGAYWELSTMTSLITTSLYISGSSVVDFEPPEGSEAPHASGKGAVESSLVSSGQRMMDIITSHAL